MITLEQLPAGQVLAGATEPTAVPEITPIERADRKANARGKAPKVVQNRVKPAAAVRGPVKKKPEPMPSETVAQIRAACESLKIETKPFGSSFVLRLPAWTEFKATLPPEGAVNEVKLFHNLRDALQKLTGDAKATWVLHRTGSFAVYSKFAK